MVQRINRGIHVYRVYKITRVNMGTQKKLYYFNAHTGDIEVYMVYSMAKVNMGTQDM